jgi:hypothetical protein
MRNRDDMQSRSIGRRQRKLPLQGPAEKRVSRKAVLFLRSHKQKVKSRKSMYLFLTEDLLLFLLGTNKRLPYLTQGELTFYVILRVQLDLYHTPDNPVYVCGFLGQHTGVA